MLLTPLLTVIRSTTNTPFISVVTNWWIASVGNYSISGVGACASFTPNSSGTGAITFYLTYVNPQPCPGSGQSTVISNSITLIVKIPPTPQIILTQPRSQSAHVGSDVTFSATVAGARQFGYQG